MAYVRDVSSFGCAKISEQWCLSVQDTTSHPTWTGEKALTGQDGRAAEFMRKFANPGASAAETQQQQQQQQQQE